jgi:hypothetical protein
MADTASSPAAVGRGSSAATSAAAAATVTPADYIADAESAMGIGNFGTAGNSSRTCDCDERRED